jgi:5'-nucleotidase
VIVVAAHAGGFCSAFDRPADLSSCDPSSEIFALARSLPRGLVDVIVAGHTHAAVAHVVEGVAIVQPFPRGAGFARVDVLFDRDTRRVAETHVFAPHHVCARQDPESLECDPAAVRASPLPETSYEGRLVVPDKAVSEAMTPALDRVRELQARPLGVFVERPIRRTGDPESPLANLLADTLRDALAVDVAVHGNIRGGLRTDILEGPLTFGGLYHAFPFDNRVLRVTLSGEKLGRALADEVRRRQRRGSLAISGVMVKARCAGEHIAMDLFRADGRRVEADEWLVVAGMDSLVAALTAVRHDARTLQAAPVLREVVEDWLRGRGGRLAPEPLVDPDRPRWDLPDAVLRGCIGL